MLRKTLFGLSLIISLQGIFATDYPEFSSRTDLTDPGVLKPLLANKFKGPEYLSKALEVSKSIYEVAPRVIETDLSKPTKYGMAFSMHPEIVAYIMKNCKGKVVLEIGGASGENAMLLAFAGAQFVYMNDIEPNEVKKFEKNKEALPPSVSNRLKSLGCDVFDLLNIDPNLSSRIDLIYCRNVLHFFTDNQLQVFFPLLKKLLKPGSQVIFTTNSAYNPSFKETINNHPLATRFKLTSCRLFDYDKKRMPIAVLAQGVSVCNEDLDPLSFTKLTLYTKFKDATGGKWVANPDAYRQLDKRTKEEFNQNKAKPEMQELFQNIKNGAVEVLINTIRSYTRESLAELFKAHGFEIDTTFAISSDGHTTTDIEFYDAPHVGIVARYILPHQ